MGASQLPDQPPVIGTTALLAVTSYRPGSDTTVQCATGASFADFDATNLLVTFTAPASGNVLVRLSATGDMTSAASSNGYWALRESTTEIGSQLVVGSGVAGVPQAKSAAIYITGVTAGSHTYKWAGRGAGGTGSVRLYGGPTWGPWVMEVFACP